MKKGTRNDIKGITIMFIVLLAAMGVRVYIWL